MFGCVAYAHVPKENRQKLDDKGEKCIFMGYYTESKAYWLYNPVTKKIIISRDVEFLENESWDGKVDSNTDISVSIPLKDEEAAEHRCAGNL